MTRDGDAMTRTRARNPKTMRYLLKYLPGILAILFGVGALLYRKFILPGEIERLAERRYRFHRWLTGERYAQKVSQQYRVALQIFLLFGGWAFIGIGILVLIGVIEFR